MKKRFVLQTGGLRRLNRPLEIAMTPMIDVIFLLLVFFLATSSLRMAEQLLPSGVSEVASGQAASDEPPPEVTPEMLDQVIVKIDGAETGDSLWFNGAQLSGWDELREHFRRIAGLQTDLPVVIDPTPQTPARSVVRAYDWARAAGLPRVYLATRPR